jgi:N-acetylmuramoyl-L-alanine amidase
VGRPPCCEPPMRRIALLSLGALLCALPATAGAAPRASDFELRVGPAAGAATGTGGAWTSPVLRPGKRFQVFGLRWRRAPEHLHARVRVRREGQRWRRWTTVGVGHGAKGSDPVWAGGADRVQLRLSRRVKGLRVHFVRVTGTPKRPQARARAAQAAQPSVIPRSQWGGDTQCTPRGTPSYGQVQMAFVHHTVSANTYGPQDSAAMVLGICRFHRNSNGWDDVGYNFLVDKYGQIFEGRAGGIDQPVVGAQAQGWNAQSTGVANIGTYSDVPQSDQAIDAMARLIAWKLPLHGVPVTGQVSLRSAGGSTNRYPSGTSHAFERISGHRDGNATSCPGDALFAQLPRLRALADGRAPDVISAQPGAGTQLTLAASRRTLSYPEPAQLSGALLDGNAQPIAGTRVRIQLLTARGYRSYASAVTGSDGRFSTSLPTSRNRTIRALVGSVTSRPVTVRVVPALQVRAPLSRVLQGRSAVLSGTLHPRKGRVVVEAARQVGATRFRPVSRFAVRVRDGRFRALPRLARPGVYRVRVRFAGDKLNAPARVDFFVRAVRSRSALTGARASGVPAARVAP